MALLPAEGLNAKHYILAAVTAALVTAIIVAVVFVVLSPARLHFSVVHADHRDFGGGQVLLRVALAASNPSRRASVLSLVQMKP
ncbi:hypothetical protein EJB05_46778, partial [Eragrostis curvula]